jgi:hypothetical protein
MDSPKGTRKLGTLTKVVNANKEDLNFQLSDGSTQTLVDSEDVNVTFTPILGFPCCCNFPSRHIPYILAVQSYPQQK